MSATLPNLIAAINGDRPPRYTADSLHEITELLNDHPPDPCEVNDAAIFGATRQPVYPKFLRIIPALRVAAIESAGDYSIPADRLYEVRLEWYSGNVPIVVHLWDELSSRILAAPLIQEAMTRAGWELPAAGNNECLKMRDGIGTDYGKPFVHFTGGAVLAWWRINEPGLHPDFLNP